MSKQIILVKRFRLKFKIMKLYSEKKFKIKFLLNLLKFFASRCLGKHSLDINALYE